MYAPADTRNLDFRLQKMVFTPAIGARVQIGAVRLLVLPCHPQPVIDQEVLSAAGIAPDDNLALISAVQRAFRQGLIASETAPIRVGNAFELLQALPAEKYSRLGTGIVRRIGITRFNQVTERQLTASGHLSVRDFADYWSSTMPDLPAITNPWCWLIQFEYRG
jgi:hypothetical protein